MYVLTKEDWKTDHMPDSEILDAILVKLPQDYEPYGAVERWLDPDQNYCDCSSGCRFYFKLADRNGRQLGADWGVCGNPRSHRAGLLTFEHQGCKQFEEE